MANQKIHQPTIATQIAILAVFLLCMLTVSLHAQNSKYSFGPGFNARECDDMFALNFAFLDTTKNNRFENFLNDHRFVYRSPSLGLDNTWDLWIRSDSTVIISLRGTTADPKSIVADFFFTMSPAKGQIILAPRDTFNYDVAADQRAAVHTGFLMGFAFLAKDIAPKVDSLYSKGYHRYMIAGHSQGGSLCYFVSSWLIHLKRNGTYPLMKVKTYASAATKVGNMYFAYDYDHITHSEWTFSIVNSADPVPEFPLTTQQAIEDVNEANPYLSLYNKLGDLPLIKRMVLKHAFNKMRKSASKSSKAYQKYLGGYPSKMVAGMVPGLRVPEFVNSTYFVRPGVQIPLLINPDYLNYFKVNDGPYYHHGVNAYRFLLRQYYEGLEDLKK